MKPFAFFIFMVIFCHFQKTTAQTSVVSGSNLAYTDLVGQGIPNHYPSEITISGGQPYIVGVHVNFPEFYLDGLARDLDILLESPNGKRVMLMSDLQTLPIHYAPAYIRISSTASNTFNHTVPSPYPNPYVFLPSNQGVEPDSFPLPGPGVLSSAPATFSEFINENPNGIWRLWIMDDSIVHTYFSLDGWSLTLETGPDPVCIQPGIPELLAVTDTSAQISWKGEGPASLWDIYYSDTDTFPTDLDENTVPHLSEWSNDSIIISDLLPAKEYKFYIRSVCPGGGRSRWMGPLTLKTTLTPCLYANSLALNQAVQCDTLPTLPDYPLGFSCWTDRKWVFRFVAPETGKYWVNTDQFSSSLWIRENPIAGICASSDWICGDIDTLTAGEAIFLVISKDVSIWNPPIFNVSRCPAGNVSLHQNSYEPLTTSVRFEGMPYNETSYYDLFYTLDPTFLPNPATIPIESDISIFPPGDQAVYPLAAHNLTPDSTYWFWVRPLCEVGVAKGAWKGPFKFETAVFCGAIDSVWIDAVTDHSARLHVVSPSESLIRVSVRLASTGQSVIHYSINFQADSAGQIFHRNIIGIQPDTAYEIFLQATCTGNENNPWYGPFPFKTLPGCFLDVQDIQCGESVSGVHFSDTIPAAFSYTSFFSCSNSWQYQPLNERLYRFTASKTGYANLDTYIPDNTGYAFVRWFIKDASLGCNAYAFNVLGCGDTDIEFVVDSGKTYLLLATGAYAHPSDKDFHADFNLSYCASPCPASDSLWLDSMTATSAALRWQNVSPGAIYRVYFNNDVDGIIQWVATSDTSIVVDNLLHNAKYWFWVTTFCSGGEPNTDGHIAAQLGDHLSFRELVFTRCNPYYLPPGGSKLSNYEIFDLKVPEDGDYRLLSSKWSNLFLYDSIFNPDAPLVHLVLAVKVTNAIGRIDTLFSLQTGKEYQLVVTTNQYSPAYYSFNANGYKDLKVLVDGPATALLSEGKNRGIEPKAHGKVPFEFVGYHTGTCRDTSGWVHFYGMATDPSNLEQDNLLLSVQINKDADSLDLLPMALYNEFPAAVLIQNPPTIFVQNPDGWYEMSRSWLMQDLQPQQQIDQDFKIRFYYTQADYELMKAAIETAGGHLDSHEDMYFHKINGFHNIQHVLPWWKHPGVPAASAYDSIGYWSYANGAEATNATWKHGTFAGEHYAEMMVHGFSGGGGGASVNGRGIFDPVSKTTGAAATLSLKLSPNPNSGIFSIELPEPITSDLRFRVVSLTGRMLHEQPAQSGETLQTIRSEQLPAGLYFLQVISDGRILTTEKFVKE
jgi:hypothetical protein